MVVETLALESLADALIGGVLAVVGARILLRPVSAASLRANQAFSTWWFALSAVFVFQAFWGATATLGLATSAFVLPVSILFDYLYYVALTGAAWGILAYLTFLLTGSRRVFLPITVFYAAYGLALLWFVYQWGPYTVLSGPWYAWVVFAHPGASLPVNILVFLLLLPLIFGSLTYGALAFRLRDPILRTRAAVVGTSLTVWLGLVLLARFLPFGSTDWWNAGGHLVGLAATILIYGAYFPPVWLLRLLGASTNAPDVDRDSG